MRRVLVVGISGAGKSTFSRALAQKTGLPLIHLDKEFWQPGWKETPRAIWRARLAELIAAINGSWMATTAARSTSAFPAPTR